MPVPDRPSGVILPPATIWVIRRQDGLMILWVNPDTGQILGTAINSYN